MRARRIAALLPIFRATRWELRQGMAWTRPPPRSPVAAVAVSAMNPDGRRLSRTANRSRDRVLELWLRRLGVPAVRCRGRLGAWYEDGFLIADGPLAGRILVRFGQLAAQRWDLQGAALAWTGGGMTRIGRPGTRQAGLAG